jgi:acyl-[acyl-carrier-protein] desaturase
VDELVLLQELTPTAERLLDRHLSQSKEWFPHEMVPWSEARDFDPAQAWEDTGALSPEVRSALLVNLLTEDNLPYYFNSINRMFGDGGAWGEWARRWTAEEARHSIVMRDYVTVTRLLDPVELERGRMHQMSVGFTDEDLVGPMDGFVYVALQELATRISHRNTGALLEDTAGRKIMDRVANDENLHYLFYKDIVQTALELDPSTTLVAIERQVRSFEMPGTGIQGFQRHAMAIARAHIYDLDIFHDKVLVPVVLKQWAIQSLEGLTAEAEKARDRLLKRLQQIRKAADRLLGHRPGNAVPGMA